MRNNHKTLCLFFLLVSFVSGCSSPEDAPPSKWRLGGVDGWYPLEHQGESLYLEGEKAYINSSSLLVNCAGKSIKVGNLSAFMDAKNKILLYSREKMAVINYYDSYIVLESERKPLHRKSTINIDIGLLGSNMATEPQCDQTSMQVNRFYGLKP